MSFSTHGGLKENGEGEHELAKRLRTTFYVAHYLAGLAKTLADKYQLPPEAVSQVIATSEILAHQGLMSDKAEEYAKLMTEGLKRSATPANEKHAYCPGKGCAICELDKKSSGGN